MRWLYIQLSDIKHLSGPRQIESMLQIILNQFQFKMINHFQNQSFSVYHQRRCVEAWHINSAHAPLNRDDGGLLPDAYLHLINR